MNKSNVKIELKSTFQDIQDTKKLLKQEQKLLEMSKANEQIATSLDNIQSKILNKSSLKSKYLNNNSIAQVSGVKPSKGSKQTSQALSEYQSQIYQKNINQTSQKQVQNSSQLKNVLNNSVLGINVNLRDFEIIDQLGQGNFGEVKLVKKLETQKYFALKCLKKEEIMRNKQIEHIKREKMLLTNIDSPFIVKLQASFQDELNLYFLMEYIQGGELFKQIGSNMMQNSNQEGLVFYLAEIICALIKLKLQLIYDQRQKRGQVLLKNNISIFSLYCIFVLLSICMVNLQLFIFIFIKLENQKIVYRDLKPENIMIDRDGHIKLIDFGFAKQLTISNNSEYRTYTNCGTPAYISPEILMGIGHCFQSDVWSLGVLICELINGVTPFHDSNTQLIYERIIQCQPNYGSLIDAKTKDLLQKIFVMDPNLRITLTDIKDHKMFRGVNWDRAQKRDLTPPFIPDLRDDMDLKYFTKNIEINQQNLLQKTPLKPKESQNNTYDIGDITPSPDGKRAKAKPLGDFRMQKINNVFEDFNSSLLND